MTNIVEKRICPSKSILKSVSELSLRHKADRAQCFSDLHQTVGVPWANRLRILITSLKRFKVKYYEKQRYCQVSVLWLSRLKFTQISGHCPPNHCQGKSMTSERMRSDSQSFLIQDQTYRWKKLNWSSNEHQIHWSAPLDGSSLGAKNKVE